MSIRRTFQINAGTPYGGSGMILDNSMDIKGRKYAGAGYMLIPYIVDVTINNRLQLGDRAGLNADSFSCPIDIVGGIHHRVKEIDAGDSPYAVDNDDNILLCDTGSGNINITLPQASTVPGKRLFFKKTSPNNTLNINPYGSETIDGKTDYDFQDMDYSIGIYCDGDNWRFLLNHWLMVELLFSVSPSYSTTSSSFSTVATSSSIWFTGRPVLFFCDGNAVNDATGDEFMGADIGLRIDSGSDYQVCQWNCNFDDNHQHWGGTKRIIPTRGNHTVSLRARRWAGSGTWRMDLNDYYSVRMIEL